MAKRVQVVLEDDLDGSLADETVSFALDGVGYEIDLSAANAAAMREAFSGYVGAARKATRGGGAGRSARRVSRTTAEVSPPQHDPSAVRAWARDQGIEVSSRGRISADVLARYDAR